MKLLKLFLFLLIFMLFLSNSFAYQSKPADVFFEDETDIFGTYKYETDWLPQNSPIQVKIIVTVGGKLGAKLKGKAELSWPPAFIHKFIGEKDGGVLWINYGISTTTKIKFSIAGYEGEFDIPFDPLSELKFDAQRNFHPFVLKGAEERPVSLEDNIGKIILADTSFKVLQVVDIKFHIDADATMNVSFTGEYIEEGGKKIDKEGGINEIEFKNNGEFNIDAIYGATYSGAIYLHFYPTAEVCVPIAGCTPLAVFDIPVELTGNSVFKKFNAIKITHPLPDIKLNVEKIDFGDVELNQTKNFPLVIKNQGKMFLEGVSELKAPKTFSLFPKEFLIAEGKEGGIMISWIPEKINEESGVVEIKSNDPDSPYIALAINGKGVKTKISEEDAIEISEKDIFEVDGEISEEVEPTPPAPTEGCGCKINSKPSSNIFYGVLFLFSFFILFSKRKWLKKI